MENDPEKAIFTFCKYGLSDAEKMLLAKGSKFCCLIWMVNIECFVLLLNNTGHVFHAAVTQL